MDFPNLRSGNYEEKSLADKRYNCIAWAAGRNDTWWDPAVSEDSDDPEVDHYWPANAPRDYKVTSLVVAYESVGFAICADGSLEDGVEKIAIYADGPEYMHAARQLENGKWTSKMGLGVDIEHDAPQNVTGPRYRQVAVYMKPPRAKASTAAISG
jgi:hypothetical protein